jgi:predicted membrane-bound mannosyltransferase
MALGAAIAVAALFYSSFGTHMSGMRDGLLAYTHGWNRATGPSGHEKPWWYYLSLFGWLRTGGLLWQQLAFSAAALGGAIAAFFLRLPILRWALIYTALIFAALSFVAYKTPWHAVHFVPSMAILASGALIALMRLPFGRVPALAAFVIILAMLAQQTRLSSFLRPADARNPFAYVHSSPDVLKVRALAESALQRSPAEPVRVIGEEYWPLPWYLRGLPGVGYWSTPPAECDGALLVVSATQADSVRARLRGQYRESFLGLRPGYLCIVFTPKP